MAKTAKAGKALRDIDAPWFGYWQALYLSFFSGRLYIDVAKRWKGLGLGYLLLLVAVVSFPFSARLAANFNVFYEQQIIDPIKQIPKIYIQNGVLSLDKPMPYRIKNKEGKVVLIIDTTGRVNAIDSANPDLTMLITRDQFFYRLPKPQFFIGGDAKEADNEVYTKPFEKSMNQIFDGEQWVKSAGLGWVKWVSDFMFYPVLVAAFFALHACFFLVLALMAQLSARLFIKQSLSYSQACRLFIVSASPTVFLLFTSLALNLKNSFIGPILLVLMMLYFSFAVFTFKQEGNQIARF
jgi:hypothetical protein